MPHLARYNRDINHVTEQWVVSVRPMFFVVRCLGPENEKVIAICIHQSAPFLLKYALMITGTVEQYVDISVRHTIFLVCSVHHACGLQGSGDFTAQFGG